MPSRSGLWPELCCFFIFKKGLYCYCLHKTTQPNTAWYTVPLISISSSCSSLGRSVNAAGQPFYGVHISIEGLALCDAKNSDPNKRYSICTWEASLMVFMIAISNSTEFLCTHKYCL